MIPAMIPAVARARRDDFDREARQRALRAEARAERKPRAIRLALEPPRLLVASLRLLARAH